MHKLLIALAAAVLAFTALAKDAPLVADDPALEKHVMAIATELRCLVCQNQTIADSHADLAVDLRQQIRELLKKGSTDQQVLSYMTDRYGDFVLYRPPVKATTWFLWFGPGVLLVAGVAGLILILRRRARMGDDRFEPDEPEAAEEQQEVRA
ncbi:cytochrome c-type biogenesis protein [Piscinibacter terrae]|uniref:Cytochrome c-type biogenesis protein n=1 Tax=Piscinibacter terrae TaxID=2496871 RepID=A0A3N7JX02_9BURK|nr:cytochrome c-type biogenesis protein [Albitalea terrae]RQP25359.1 cytochrome c-type biogenesis protein CcmH [Albitalea terrae]